MPRFSLIVATLGRTEELEHLFCSFAYQRRSDYEVVVVDQNEDDRLSGLIAAAREWTLVKHVRTKEKGVSRARNLGMIHAQGEIIAFPDDDCWYPENLLNVVDNWFRAHPEYAVLAVGAVDDRGVSSGNRWIQNACDITPFNSLRTTFCSSLFISTVEQAKKVRFDENLSRGEETDFVLRLLKTGLRGRFDRAWHVHHPCRDMLSGAVSKERATSYGAGMGRLVRSHCLFTLWVALLAYDLLRTMIVFLRGQDSDASCCLAHAWGLFRGFVSDESPSQP
jgi:glycosyltransferase involved in cell wall biosynthesis